MKNSELKSPLSGERVTTESIPMSELHLFQTPTGPQPPISDNLARWCVLERVRYEGLQTTFGRQCYLFTDEDTDGPCDGATFTIENGAEPSVDAVAEKLMETRARFAKAKLAEHKLECAACEGQGVLAWPDHSRCPACHGLGYFNYL